MLACHTTYLGARVCSTESTTRGHACWGALCGQLGLLSCSLHALLLSPGVVESGYPPQLPPHKLARLPLGRSFLDSLAQLDSHIRIVCAGNPVCIPCRARRFAHSSVPVVAQSVRLLGSTGTLSRDSCWQRGHIHDIGELLLGLLSLSEEVMKNLSPARCLFRLSDLSTRQQCLFALPSTAMMDSKLLPGSSPNSGPCLDKNSHHHKHCRTCVVL